MNIESAIEHYELDRVKYKDFFDEDLFQEFQDDPGIFKTNLSKKCPVIQKTLHSKREELKEWQQRFVAAPSKTLFQIFDNDVQR